MITLFFMLSLVAHLVGDYLIQTEVEANQKAVKNFFNWPLLRHVIKYTACISAVIIYCGVSYWWVLWIFTTHYVLDRRAFVLWWRKKIMRSSEETIQNTFWLTILVDQIFHVLAIAVITMTL